MDISLPWAEFVSFWANWTLIGALLVGVLATIGVVVSANIKEAHWERERLLSSERISDNETETARANESAGQARKDTSLAQERIANLTADNLALQTVLLSRHFGLIGIDGPPKGEAWVVTLNKFAGTEISIQVVDDAEAKNLANAIVNLLSWSGWKANIIDEKRSNLPEFRIPEGVTVSYPTGKAWTAKEPIQPWMAWANAAESLANALTDAGLGVGDKPVSRFGFLHLDNKKYELLMTEHFDPPLTGVYLQVGARPVAATVEWIKQGRPDPSGKLPAPALPEKSSKPQ